MRQNAKGHSVDQMCVHLLSFALRSTIHLLTKEHRRLPSHLVAVFPALPPER
jgi:hypothetical protein